MPSHDASVRPATPEFLAGGGEMGALMRAHDWSASPLGDPHTWPQSLRSVVGLLLNSKFPMFLAWGDELGFLYNDSYIEILGAKHPRALGRAFHDIWAEIWPDISPLIDAAMAGEASYHENLLLIMNRKEFDEQTWFTFSYSPVRNESGRVAGMYCACTETTAQVLAERQLREGEARFRALVNASSDVVYRMSPDWTEMRQLDGRGFITDTDEPSVRWIDEYIFPEDRPHVVAAISEAVRTKGVFELEHRVRRVDGKAGWTFSRAVPVLGADGEIVEWFGMAGDVTARHEVEEALRESEARFRNMADHAPVMTWVTDANGYCTYLNRAWYQFTGQTREKAEGFGWLDATHPDDKAEAERVFLEANAVQRPFRLEYRLRRADGAYRWAIDAASPRVGADGEYLGYVGSVIEIDERREAEAALRESEERYRTLFENIEAGFCVIDVLFDEAERPVDYRFVEVNPAFAAQTDLVDAIGRRMREFAPDMEQHWFDLYGSIALTGIPQRFENEAVALGRWYEVDAFRVGEPEQRRVAVLFNDVSDRKRAEARIRELNDTLEAQVAARSAERDRLWNLSQDMLARADYSGMMSAVSPAWTQVLGWSETELLSRGYSTFMHPEDMPPTLDAIGRMAETRQPSRFENRIATQDGSWKQIEWTVAPEPDGMNFIAVGRDISLAKAREAALEAAQEALRQSQKMEAMGSLTGGVAHDFNNLLTPIVGALDLLQRRGVGGEREQRLINGAAQSAERAKVLVQRLLAFARRQPLQPVAVDVAKLVRNMAGLVASTTGPQIRVSVEVPEDLPAAKADPNQLEMALLNLAVNARDAMPEGGTLRISASADMEGAGSIPELRPGRYVRVSVADNGIGMDEATLARAVEPFFSTKGVGKGTGLGLSMVHGLAAQLGGALTIKSEVGLGTNIELWLPQTEEVLEAALVAPDGATIQVRGTALLVDDEEFVRLSTADMLNDLGYRVVEAASAEEALRVIGNGSQVDVVVTDHLMPGMTGTDLARAVRDHRPDLPVLVVSGYADVDGIALDLPRLTKPFRKDELAASLAALFSSRVV